MKEELLQSALAEYFAPWVQSLGLKVESFEDGKSASRASVTYALM